METSMARRDRERAVREQEMVLAAERVFSQKGYESASMDEIAKEAQFTKRTLYQYFQNKEELYFAVVKACFVRLSDHLAIAGQSAFNGYERMRQISQSMYRFYQQYPETFRLIGYMGYVRKQSAQENKRRDEALLVNNDLFEAVGGIIAEGKQDGSMRSDLNPQKTALSLIFLLTGFFNQLSVSGQTFAQHFAIQPEEFGTDTIDMLLHAVKNQYYLNERGLTQ